MSVAPEPGSLGSQQTLFGHALSLHRQAPESPLPRDGEPYPDHERHHRCLPKRPNDSTLVGADAARALREHFANPVASPSDLVDAFHDMHISIHLNEHIAAAARQADPVRVRATGRWLVRHSTDRCSAITGLALIAVVGEDEDIPLIQTIGLLSDKFAPLAARALERLGGGTTALLWLADRVAGWGRVYVVEALYRLADPAARPWLLRRAVDGEFLNGYFAGKVAEVSALHEAITDSSVDDDVVDHAGRLLHVLTYSEGMGTSIRDYPHAARVFDAHVRRFGVMRPTARRFATAAMLADYLSTTAAEELGWPQGQLDGIRDDYLSVLDRDEWCEVARRAVNRGDEHLHRDYLHWLAGTVGRRLGLRAFTGIQLPAEE